MKIDIFRWELKNYGSTLKRTLKMFTANAIFNLTGVL